MNLLLCISVLFAIYWEVSSDDIVCPTNMKAFLVNENSTEKFCDCEDTFLYNSKDDFCYDAYRQGPCPSGQYYVLPPGKLAARCKKNPCRIDGLVPFEGRCHLLWDWTTDRPCEDESHYLGVNDDFQLECSRRAYLGYYLNVRISKSCPENSYLKATNDNSGFYCECKTTFIYSRKHNSCHQAYRQGSCAPGNYIVLPRGEMEPRCERNPCRKDGLAPFQDRCYEIYKTGPPCDRDNPELTVTDDTFELKCMYRPKPSAGGGGIINAPLKACPAGSRRVLTGCKKQFQ